MKKIFALAIVSVLASQTALAHPCDSMTSQSQMNECADNALKQADTRLNQTYQKYMKTLAPSEKIKLRNAERKWIKQKDATCKKAVAKNKGGSISGTAFAMCLEEKTNARQQALQKMMK